MREIIFRGYNRKNGHWLYGSYVKNRGVDFVCPDEFADGKSWDDYEVDSASLGEYTGLGDSFSNEIYEGDIVRHPYIDPIFGDFVDGTSVESPVVFHDGAFVVRHREDGFVYLDAFVRKCHIEVVDTVYKV